MSRNEQISNIIKLINDRKYEVLKGNSVEEGSLEYQWVSGIYDDIAEYIEFNSHDIIK